jgi:hypothetical protein
VTTVNISSSRGGLPLDANNVRIIKTEMKLTKKKRVTLYFDKKVFITLILTAGHNIPSQNRDENSCAFGGFLL